MNNYTLYWNGGDKTIIQGLTIVDAFCRNFITNTSGINFYLKGIDKSYKFVKNQWVKRG